MKAAFTAQYSRRFVSAGVEASRYTHPEMLKSCVNDNFINSSSQQQQQQQQHQQYQQQQQSEVNPATKQKRSRWD
ncbi:unnamed protein product [Trichobilharzia regenti]|nr:unnamed protein product [Trichobilharzia regenti]